MTHELYWLVLSILVTSLLWVPYIINRVAGAWHTGGSVGS